MAWTTIGKLISAINRWLAEQKEGLASVEERTGLPQDDQDDHSFYGALATDQTDQRGQGPSFIPSPFAEEWYRMRELGEHDRAQALSMLYTSRPQPGGSHPDPRAPAAFSTRAILAALARIQGVVIWPVPENTGAQRDPRSGVPKPTQHPVWLITFPVEATGRRRQPNIAVTQQEEEDLMLWYVSCMLGAIAREPHRITDRNVPAGVTTLPTDPMTRALIHRYAHALMLVDFDCSQAFGCACSAIEHALNTPPRDHPQPTQTLPAQRVKPVISQPTSPPDRSDPSHQRPPKKSNPLGEG